jgi:dTMP kinase
MLLFLASTSADSRILRDILMKEHPDLLFIDRYYLCSIVYGVALLSIHSSEPMSHKIFEYWLQTVETTGRDILLNPDLYVIVNTDEETRMRRLALKGKTFDSRFSEDRRLMEAVLMLYRYFSDKYRDKAIWVENPENLLRETASRTAEKLIEKLWRKR